MLDYSRRKLRSKNFLKELKKKIKGSIKEPYFRFWPIVLFLFIFVFLNISLTLNWIKEKNNIYLTDASSEEEEETVEEFKKNDFFIYPLSGFSPESPEMLLVENSFVKASSPLTFFSPQVLGVSADNYQEQEETRTEIIEHIVQDGETLSSLAQKYNISLDTIVWANDGLSRNSSLKIGQKLVILPNIGVVHYVKSGDTISGITQRHKGEISEVIAFNNLSGEADIYIGDFIIIPNGTMPVPVIQKKLTNTASSPVAVPSTPLPSSYFIIPVSSPYIITQGLHWHNAIDFSHQGYACGKPVYAVAGGTVQRVIRSQTGYGNYVTILHPNNVVTLYAHLSTITVSPGLNVSQGSIVGHIGNSGYTVGRTGCHLHFEVRGATNPFSR